MKKIFKSRGFLITMLSVCCVAILGICWTVNRDKNSPFTADEPPPSTVSQEWVEASSETEPETEETTKAEPETTLAAKLLRLKQQPQNTPGLRRKRKRTWLWSFLPQKSPPRRRLRRREKQ